MASPSPSEQAPSNGRSAIRRAAWRLAASAALLVVLVWLLDTSAIASTLANAETLPILAALLLVQAQVVLSAWRWRLIAGTLGMPLTFGVATSEYYRASLLNLVLPGGMPGDALRAFRLAQGPAAHAWRPVVRSIVLERVAGQITLAGVMVAGFAAWPLLLGERIPDGAAHLAAGGLVLGCGVALLIVVAAKGGPAALRSALAGLGPDLHRAFASGGAWWKQGGLNLAIVAGYIAAFALAAAALGQPLPWVGWITVVPVVLFSMALPLTVGGWGVREGVAASLWPLLGLDPTLGFATGLLYGTIALVGSLPGVAFLMFRFRDDAQPATGRRPQRNRG